jgi:hypothetical protein
MRRLTFVAIATAVAACSLSLEGYSGGADGADASGGPAPPPGSAGDDGPNPPPGVPPGTPVPPPPPPGDAGISCVGTVLCDDFDHAALGAKWTAIRDNGAGSITLDSKAAVTTPNALLAVIAAGQDGADHYLTAHLDSVSTKDLDMEADIRIEGPCSANILDLGIDATNGYLFRLAVDGATTTLQEYNEPPDAGSTQKDLGTVAALPVGTWQHVKVRANLGAKTGEYWLNGIMTKTVTLAPLSTTGSPHFRAGIVEQDSATGCAVRYDNVLVRAR